MLLRDFSLGASRHEFAPLIASQFEDETRCVAALFERCFGRRDMGNDTWRIWVEVVRKIDADRRLRGEGVITVQIQGDVLGFLELPRQDKKPQALDWLMEGIATVAEFHGWPMSPFNEAADRVRELGYENEYSWRRPRLSPSRTLKAEVLIKHDIESTTFDLLIKNRSGKVLQHEREIYSASPSEYAFVPQLGELRWHGNDLVVIVPKHYTEGQEVEGYWQPIEVAVDVRDSASAEQR